MFVYVPRELKAKEKEEEEFYEVEWPENESMSPSLPALALTVPSGEVEGAAGERRVTDGKRETKRGRKGEKGRTT
jgi:DUF971 family protein